MLEYFVDIEACPVCRCRDNTFESVPLKNLYSEKLSILTSIDEQVLLKFHANYRCSQCGLVYKRRWFRSHILRSLFTDCVPTHPKGWDTGSVRFSFGNFYRELGHYESAIFRNNTAEVNRYRRALLSILDASPGFSRNATYTFLFKAIENDDTAIFHDAGIQQLVRIHLEEARPYSRFSGFADSGLWDFLASKLGSFSEYDELGCPLWGLLRIALSNGLNSRYYRRNEANYWANACMQGGVHCTQYLQKTGGIEVRSWEEPWDSGMRDMLGLFQYLDHLDAPLNFLDQVFSRYKNAAIILDYMEVPVAIQHLSGFGENTMHYLAGRYQKKLHIDFDPIKKAGNILYLFQDESN